MAVFAGSVGLSAQETEKPVVFVDSNKHVWERDTYNMLKGVTGVIWNNKLLLAKMFCNRHSVVLDIISAWRSTLCDAQGRKIHGLNGYMTYFAERYNQPTIMNAEAPIDEALAYVRPRYDILPRLNEITQQGNALYLMSSNDRTTTDKKMAVYVTKLQEKGLQVPQFAGTFIAPEYAECHQYGTRSQECKQKMKEFADNPQNISFLWEEADLAK